MFPSPLKAVLLTLLLSAACVLSDAALHTGLVVSPAQARIGRPLTPVSFAGVARRTTRRAIIATSIYAASLPRGCTTVIVDGTSLYHCGGTYYQAVGSQYVVVRVQ